MDNHDNRNLSDVFRELQQAQQIQINHSNKHRKKSCATKNSFVSHFQTNHSYKNYDLKLSHIIVGCSILGVDFQEWYS